MSLWNPHAQSNKPQLTVQFNKQVSDAAYARARDEVLMTKGVKFDSENAKERTMVVTGGNADEIENIPGVESCTRVKSSPGYGGYHRL